MQRLFHFMFPSCCGKEKTSYDLQKSGSPFTGENFQVNVYGSDSECTKLEVDPSGTYENICEAVAEHLQIPPVLFHCFGFCVLKEEEKCYRWLPPKKIIKTAKEVYFRMRFLPPQHNIEDVKIRYPDCVQYLFYQLKWDFLHEFLSYYKDAEKASEARGAGMFLLMSSLRIWAKENNKDENCKEFLNQTNLKMFLPECLVKTILDTEMLKPEVIKRVHNYLLLYPKENHSAEVFQNLFVHSILLKCSKTFYNLEEYRCWMLNLEYTEVKQTDSRGHTTTLVIAHLSDLAKKETLLTVAFEGKYSLLQISSTNTETMNDMCRIESLSKVESCTLDVEGVEWHKVTIVAQGFLKDLYFQDGLNMYSFLTALEKCYCLYFDFYGSICEGVQSPTITKLHRLRVHGPVSKDLLKKKLQKYIDSGQVYAIRISLDKYGYYDVFYMTNTGDNEPSMLQIGKVIHNQDGYKIKDVDTEAVADLKTFLMQQISSLRTILTGCTRIKPHSEGCDTIWEVLMDRIQLQSSEETEDDEQALRRLERAPKLYMPRQVVVSYQIGVGYFTEVNMAVLNENHKVIVKRLKRHPSIKQNRQELKDALIENVNKLM